MNLLTLTEIRRAAQNGPVTSRVHVQVESATPKLTREQQPYCELALVDACDRMTLRVWSDHPAYKTCSTLTERDFVELIAGILFHDSGKLWENQYSESGFIMAYDEIGELMGHISVGVELANSLWRRLSGEHADAWKNLAPPSEDVRMHLLHLIGSHHGE